MTKKELKIYQLWLDDKITLGQIAKELSLSSRTMAYTVLANCAKYIHHEKS